MGEHRGNIGRDEGKLAAEPRSFLFLQGPISDFFDQLGRALLARGHRVHRINLHLGDQLFWRLPATHFRGRFDDWRGFAADMLEAHQVTDLVIHGDRRPYHLVAAEEARARGIAVIATDLGYVRPDWITLEADGMSTYSRFPREPDAIRALAQELPAPDLTPRYHTPFRLIAALDVAYNLGLVFGRLLYPYYCYHGMFHPFAEYVGWIGSRAKRLVTARASAAAKPRLQAAPGSYFLFPLQLAADYQIRAHSPFADAREAVRYVIASFAQSGSARKLVVIVHPLDNGLINWCRLVAELAQELGISDRLLALDGGTPHELLCNAAGIVTVNSTVGTTALYQGVPVKVLGNAVFDIPGLTSQQPLDAFWQAPSPPDPELTDAFLRALIGTTQVKGGYYTRASQAEAIAGFVERLEGTLHPLPPLGPAQLAARPARMPARSIVVAGATDAVGLAVARAYAAPGIALCLVGNDAEALAAAVEDCRRRGAVATGFESNAHSEPALAARLRARDREAPVDVLAVHVGADLAAARAMVDALAEALRRRGRGRIVLIGSRTGGLFSYGRSVRQSVGPRGVSVAIAAPGRLAARLAAGLGHAEILRIGSDRAARLICLGVGRRRDAIALPGALTAALRALRLAPSLVRRWARGTLIPRVEPVVDPVGEEPLPVPGESGTGN